MIINITNDMLNGHLKEQINKIWHECALKEGKIPYIVEEAAFSSIVLSSIYHWIKEQDRYDWFALSEAQVKRFNGKGYVDILLFTDGEAHFFELKGACYGASNGRKDVANILNALEYAKYQASGIDPRLNEEWYKFEAKIKHTWCIGMLCSIVSADGSSNYQEIKSAIIEEQNMKNDSLQTDTLKIFATEQFVSDKYPIITDKNKEYSNDGYFIVGYNYPMEA